MNVNIPQSMQPSVQHLVLPSLLLAGASLVDFGTPLGIAAGVLYVFPVLATCKFNSSRMTWIFGIISIGLIIFGWWLSSEGGVAWQVLVNRLVSILAVVVTSFIVAKGAPVSQSLSESEARNQRILNSAGEGIWGLDLQGNTTFVNTKAIELLGYTSEELVGSLMHAKVHHTHPDGRPYPREACPMYAASKDGALYRVEDEVLWRKDGTSFPVSYTSTPQRNHLGQITGAVVVFQDITDRKKSEQKLVDYTRALEMSNQELDDFAYIASHDLKEPLRGIHNYSKILLEDHGETLNDEAQSRCQTILRLSQRMDTLLDALLYFSRVGRSELAVVPTDLNIVIGNVLESLDVSLKEHSVFIQVPQIFPTVACDGTRVGEIYRNLITNAMKYNDKAEKWIEIGYVGERSDEADAPASLTFFVRDNGIGIREKHLGSICRIFKRLHGRDKFGGGTGSGLTLTKKMVERHGGLLWVESTYGEGSTFYFTLGPSEVVKSVVGEATAISRVPGLEREEQAFVCRN